MSPQLSDIKASREQLLNFLAKDAYRYGQFKLSSGQVSNHYVNCKPVSLSGEGLLLISLQMLQRIEPNSLAVAGLTLGADPLVSGVAMAAAQSNRALNALIVRKEVKGHGTTDLIEGPSLPEGSRVTVLEDVVTTGGSSLKAVQRLREANYEVERVISIVDREEGGNSVIASQGLELVSLFLLNEVIARSKELLQ